MAGFDPGPGNTACYKRRQLSGPWNFRSNGSDRKQMGRNSASTPASCEKCYEGNKQGTWIENNAAGEEFEQKEWPGMLSPRSSFLSRFRLEGWKEAAT